MTPNTFPLDFLADLFTRTELPAGTTTDAFTWAVPGLYIISVAYQEASKGGSKSATFQVSGSTTPLITFSNAGYYEFMVPQGGATYTFTAVSAVKNFKMGRYDGQNR